MAGGMAGVIIIPDTYFILTYGWKRIYLGKSNGKPRENRLCYLLPFFPNLLFCFTGFFFCRFASMSADLIAWPFNLLCFVILKLFLCSCSIFGPHQTRGKFAVILILPSFSASRTIWTEKGKLPPCLKPMYCKGLSIQISLRTKYTRSSNTSRQANSLA